MPAKESVATPKSRVRVDLADVALRPTLAQLFFPTLLAVRLVSARLNTIHDCDETYNFLEPLHFLLYGSGLQTWEHSPQFALRSYLYLLLHAMPLSPVRLLLHTARGKRAVFFILRGILGAASAAVEAKLCRACGHRRLALLLWVLLLSASGLFTAATTFLPSTFFMLALTLGTALCLEARSQARARIVYSLCLLMFVSQTAVAVCTLGGLVGWPFAGLAAVPVGIQAVFSDGVVRTACSLLGTALPTLLATLCCDRLFYGRLTVCARLRVIVCTTLIRLGGSCPRGIWFATTCRATAPCMAQKLHRFTCATQQTRSIWCSHLHSSPQSPRL